MADSPDNPVLIPDPLGRPPVRGRSFRPSTIVLHREADPAAPVILSTANVMQVLDDLSEAKHAQQRDGVVDDDFAAGYITAIEEVKALVRQVERPRLE